MLTVAVPTFGRGAILAQTLRYLFEQKPAPTEILVLDQTKRHEADIDALLSGWEQEGRIVWIRFKQPSITKAMNHALRAANCDRILFLDDDIIPEPGMIGAHLRALERKGADVVAGRVIQPWEEDKDVSAVPGFHFAQKQPAWTSEFMGGNFSIYRDVGLDVGGFDENFVHVGYHFEAEFAYRLRQAHHRIYFEPAACVHHLKVNSGGTRVFGDHLRTFWPSHAVGAYYFVLRTGSGFSRLLGVMRRGARALANRHHLQKPWWIPATVIAELLGLVWAAFLVIRGPRLLVRTQGSKH